MPFSSLYVLEVASLDGAFGYDELLQAIFSFLLLDGFFLAVLRDESSSRDAKVVLPLDRKVLIIRLIMIR